MLIDMSHHDGKITAAKQVRETFSVLTFRQGTTSVVIILPPRMAACVAMIEEAFNAHMSDDPKTVVAQGGDTGYRSAGFFMDVADENGESVRAVDVHASTVTRHEMPADRFAVTDGYAIPDDKPINTEFSTPFGLPVIGALDSVGFDLRAGSPAFDMATAFHVEKIPGRYHRSVAPEVGELSLTGSIRILNGEDGSIQFMTKGRVWVTEETAAKARICGWKLSERDEQVLHSGLVVIERGADEIRIPGENAVTGGPSDHVS